MVQLFTKAEVPFGFTVIVSNRDDEAHEADAITVSISLKRARNVVCRTECESLISGLRSFDDGPSSGPRRRWTVAVRSPGTRPLTLAAVGGPCPAIRLYKPEVRAALGLVSSAPTVHA